MAFSIGSTVRTTGTFRAAGTLTDPTTINLKVHDPAGTETTYTYPATLTRTSLGIYYKDLPVTLSGNWYVRWIGTGTVPEADEDGFFVEASRFTTP